MKLEASYREGVSLPAKIDVFSWRGWNTSCRWCALLETIWTGDVAVGGGLEYL